MKKRFLLFLIQSLCFTAWAQQTSTIEEQSGTFVYNAKVSFGVQAGINYSSLDGSELDFIFADQHVIWKRGWFAGLSVNNQLSPHFGLRHELLFSKRTAGVQLSDSINGTYPSSMNTYYLELHPASFAFSIKGFQLHAGPYVNSLIGASLQRKDSKGDYFRDHSLYGSPDNNERDSRYLQKFDFGLHVALEYQFRSRVSVRIAYAHGLTDIFQYANSYTLGDTKTDNIRIYNRAVTAGLGYTFHR